MCTILPWLSVIVIPRWRVFSPHIATLMLTPSCTLARSHTLLVETRAVPLAANSATRIDYLTASSTHAAAATAALPLPPHLLHTSDPSAVLSASAAASAVSASALAASTYLTQYHHARGARYDWSSELVGVAQPMAANQRFFFRVAPAAADAAGNAEDEEDSLFEEQEKETKKKEEKLVCYYDSLDQRVNATKRLVVRLVCIDACAVQMRLIDRFSPTETFLSALSALSQPACQWFLSLSFAVSGTRRLALARAAHARRRARNCVH